MLIWSINILNVTVEIGNTTITKRAPLMMPQTLSFDDILYVTYNRYVRSKLIADGATCWTKPYGLIGWRRNLEFSLIEFSDVDREQIMKLLKPLADKWEKERGRSAVITAAPRLFSTIEDIDTREVPRTSWLNVLLGVSIFIALMIAFGYSNSH